MVPAGQHLSWGRRSLAPSFGKPEFHIIFLPPNSSSKNLGPTLQSCLGELQWEARTDPHIAPGGIFQRKDWA